jgi:CDP-diglyceride synthetase
MPLNPNISKTRDIVRTIGGAVFSVLIIWLAYLAGKNRDYTIEWARKASQNIPDRISSITSMLPADGILACLLKIAIVVFIVLLIVVYYFFAALADANLGGPGLDMANREISKWLKTRKKRTKDKIESNSKTP